LRLAGIVGHLGDAGRHLFHRCCHAGHGFALLCAAARHGVGLLREVMRRLGQFVAADVDLGDLPRSVW
jgi:hypothetical protein